MNKAFKMNLFLFRCSALSTHAMTKVSTAPIGRFSWKSTDSSIHQRENRTPLSYERGWHWLTMDVELDAAVVG
jgi:hypothetical protein